MLVLAFVAALLLIAAELSTVASVSVADSSCEVVFDTQPEIADRCELSGWERHGGALVLLALVAAGAGYAALRGVGGAAPGAILAAVGLVVFALALIGDLPETGETGAIGNDFDGATAQAGLGFYLELLGGALCVLGGALALASRSGTALGAQAPQAEAREDLDRAAHDEADAGDQRQRLEADVGIGDDDHPDRDAG